MHALKFSIVGSWKPYVKAATDWRTDATDGRNVWAQSRNICLRSRAPGHPHSCGVDSKTRLATAADRQHFKTFNVLRSVASEQQLDIVHQPFKRLTMPDE